MAFTTIQGSAANDGTSFVGTSGVDSVLVQNEKNFFVGAQLAGDTIQYTDYTNVVSGATMKGGQGNDAFDPTAAQINLNNAFINGNKDTDTFGTNVALGTATNTTLYGGQGNDTITFGNTIFSSVINGNKDTDVMTTAGITGGSFYGGQGTDTLNIVGATNTSVVQGDADNDTLNIQGTFAGSKVNGGAGNDSINDGGVITTFATSTIHGGAGNDTITMSNTAANVGLTISADLGNDSAIATSNSDSISGGSGTDTLSGALGTDTLDGGAGVDTYRYAAAGTTSVDADVFASGAFNAGAAGDVFDVNPTTTGLLANLTAAVNTVVGSATNTFIADSANTGYATFLLAEAAVEAANNTTLDYVVIFRNTTSGNVEAWADATSAAAGTGVQLVSDFGVAAANQAAFLTAFVAANVSVA